MIGMELAQHLVTTVSFDSAFNLSSDLGGNLIARVGAIGSWDWGFGQPDSLLGLLNTDVFAGTRSFFDHFFKTGQAWALLIGIIVGYVLRSFTSYG